MCFSAIGYFDNAGCSSAGGIKQRWGAENELFSSWMRQYLENGKRYVQSYY